MVKASGVKSAGVILFRRTPQLEVLLGHPGGPFYVNRDAWSIHKGLVEEDEPHSEAAAREFFEETGQQIAKIGGPLIPLGQFVQPSGKTIIAFACEGNCDPTVCVSNDFEMEWPLKSKQMQWFPEIERSEWFELNLAVQKLHKGQIPIIVALEAYLNG